MEAEANVELEAEAEMDAAVEDDHGIDQFIEEPTEPEPDVVADIEIEDTEPEPEEVVKKLATSKNPLMQKRPAAAVAPAKVTPRPPLKPVVAPKPVVPTPVPVAKVPTKVPPAAPVFRRGSEGARNPGVPTGTAPKVTVKAAAPVEAAAKPVVPKAAAKPAAPKADVDPKEARLKEIARINAAKKK